jgi:hypothetical protein
VGVLVPGQAAASELVKMEVGLSAVFDLLGSAS